MPPLLWTEKQDVGPAARVGAALAFDSAREQVVLFGGSVPAGVAFADTWVWAGVDWTQVADTGPDARSGHALSFDSGRDRLVLFGGIAADGSLRGDTWEWDGESWTQVADTGPDARSGHGLAFDGGRSLTTLFGGNSSGPTLHGDTWAWDGSGWTQEQDVGPAARQGHGLTFDSTRSQVLLYGGETADAAVGDTWTWDGTVWTERSHFGPPACVDASLVFDGGSALLYGGVASLTNAAAQVFAGSWEWDGQHWTQRQDIGPGPRWGHAMAFDSTRGCCVLYGGASLPPGDAKVAQHVLGDTWEEQGTPIAPPTPIAVAVAKFEVTPASAGAGQSVTFAVTLDQPAPKGGVTVLIRTRVGEGEVLPDGFPHGQIVFSPGSLTGQVAWVVPADVAAGLNLPIPLEASIDGRVEGLSSITLI